MNDILASRMMSRPIRGSLRMTWRGGGEYTGIVPSDFNEHDWSEIEEMMIMDSDFVERQYLKSLQGLLHIGR